MLWNSGKTLVIVTGASRGLGQAIALQMSRAIAEPTLVLISRSTDDLKRTENFCKNANEKCLVISETMDLSTADVKDFNDVLDKIDSFASFKSLVLVHNAGSLGNQGTKVADFDNVQVLQDYYRLNVVSVMLLNSVVLKRCKDLGQVMTNKLVVNISSLAALQPFETWGCYCSGKAARDSLFNVMAAEEPSWKVLNYAPGPLETKMIEDLLADQATHENIRNAFQDMKSQNQLLKPETSAERLIEILDRWSFKSGAHIDFFDHL